MNSAFEINMTALSNELLKQKLANASFEDASKEFNCFIAKSGDYALAKKNFPYDDIENPVQGVIDSCKSCIKGKQQTTDFIVIYGLGLGYILDEVYTRYKSRIILYEPDLNVLRFVFENVDLSHILSDSRVFITDSYEECSSRIGRQYLPQDKIDIVYLRNYGLIKPAELIKLSNMIFNTCKARIADINTINTISKIWVKNIVENIESSSPLKPLYNLENSACTGTALILSAGPSLLDNLQNIKTNREKFTIFAAPKTLKTLNENGIIPDFAVFIDASWKCDISSLPQDFVSKIYAAADVKSDSKIVNFPWKDLFYYFTNISEFVNMYSEKNGIISYPSIATAALNALYCAAKMGFKKIALCGFDLAFKDDIAFCSGEKAEIFDNKVKVDDIYVNLAQVKSVSGKMVKTREDFAVLIPQFENSIKLIDDDVNIYNITDFGAYLKGLNYTTLDAILPKNNSYDINEILSNIKFDKLNLKNDLETELDKLSELQDEFSDGNVNFSKVYMIKDSALLSEYTRYEILQLVQGGFSEDKTDTFIKQILDLIKELKQMILKNLVEA